MADKEIDVRFGEEVAGRTIVGGRNHATASGSVSVPVGIEKVLYLAASDPAFRTRLLSQRQETLGDPRLRLDEAERDLLSAIPAEQLRTMIERIDPRAHGKRRFMRSVAAASAALASTTMLAVANGCAGEMADDPTDRVDAQVQSVPDAAGVRPDFDAQTIAGVDAMPPDSVDAEVPMVSDAGGARPDDPDAGTGD